VKNGNKWNTACQPHTIKVMVFITGGNFKTRECWYTYGPGLDNETICLFRRKRKEALENGDKIKI
jgi:hypothetical protein